MLDNAFALRRGSARRELRTGGVYYFIGIIYRDYRHFRALLYILSAGYRRVRRHAPRNFMICRFAAKCDKFHASQCGRVGQIIPRFGVAVVITKMSSQIFSKISMILVICNNGVTLR
jgi:hypothetical protein